MYRHIFDRSKLDEVIVIKADGTRETRRQWLETHGMGRTDIVLFNGTRSGAEYTLHVRMEGYSGDTWLLDLLTDEEFTHVEGIAERMRQNARDFAPAWKLLS